MPCPHSIDSHGVMDGATVNGHTQCDLKPAGTRFSWTGSGWDRVGMELGRPASLDR